MFISLLPVFFLNAGAYEAEKTLMKTLFSNYTLKVRPAISPEQRVVVRVGMILSSFVGLVRLPTPNNAWAESCAHHDCSSATYLCRKSGGLHTYAPLTASRMLKIEFIVCSQIHVSKCGCLHQESRQKLSILTSNRRYILEVNMHSCTSPCTRFFSSTTSHEQGRDIGP